MKATSQVEFVSNLWVCRYSDPEMYQNKQILRDHYIGPKDQEAEMIKAISDFFVKRLQFIHLSIGEVTDEDRIFSYKSGTLRYI